MLIDLMVKNQLQNKCGAEMIQLLEQMSLENQQAVSCNFPLDIFSRANLSLGAQRNFDRIMQVFKRTKTSP